MRQTTQYETAQAHIHSLQGAKGTVAIIEEKSLNDIVAQYQGKFYKAIFNPFSVAFYVDDLYGHLPDYAVPEKNQAG